jgi:hypothetical protein
LEKSLVVILSKHVIAFFLSSLFNICELFLHNYFKGLESGYQVNRLFFEGFVLSDYAELVVDTFGPVAYLVIHDVYSLKSVT